MSFFSAFSFDATERNARTVASRMQLLKTRLPDWVQDWLEVIIPGTQILLILFVAWLLQRVLRRIVRRASSHYQVPDELVVPLNGLIRWIIVASALLLVLERMGVSATVLWTAFTGFATVGAVLRELEPEDLLKFGMIPEFVGRLPMVGAVHSLKKDALVQILTEPKNALVKQYQKFFEFEDVELVLTPEALSAIADAALTRGTGARGLRAILENVLLDTMYDLPSLDGVEEVVINREVIEGRAQPLYVHGERQEGVAAAPA